MKFRELFSLFDQIVVDTVTEPEYKNEGNEIAVGTASEDFIRLYAIRARIAREH